MSRAVANASTGVRSTEGSPMSTLHLVFGPQGAGKSTEARRLAAALGAVRMSIDDWMAGLFGPDLPLPLDLGWVMERVRRCEQRIGTLAVDIARAGTPVVLDLGFMRVDDRRRFAALAHSAGLACQLHHVDAPLALRRQRVATRNLERSDTFAFEVTPAMFDAMEGRFEPPTAEELATARIVCTGA